jgi:hypothetical protein
MGGDGYDKLSGAGVYFNGVIDRKFIKEMII